LLNASDSSTNRVLALNTRFMNHLDAYLVRDGKAELITSDSETAPFWARKIPYRLVTGRFTLNPRQRAAILIGYSSDGTTALPFTIETEMSFLERKIFEETKNAAFFAAAGVMILFSLIFMPVVRWRVHLTYAVYFTWVVLYVAHMDGYSLQYLWPGWPELNAYAALPLGYSINIFAAVFCRAFLKTPRDYPVIDKILMSVIWCTVGVILVGSFLDTQWIKRFGFIYTFAASVIFISAGLVALRKGQPGLRFFILGWIGIIASAAFSTFAHWKTGAVAVNASFDTIRAGILIEASMLMLAMVEQLRVIRRERDSAVIREKETLKEKIGLERRRAYAEALADARRAQLASASHDLKQPLVSLKMMLQRVIGNEDATISASVRNAVDYLEKLVQRYLEETDTPPIDESGKSAEPAILPGQEEDFGVSLILDNVVRMFSDEAKAKGLELRLVPSQQLVRAEPMTTMRIVSNIVANAVKHTRNGRVLVGCRKAGDRIRIEVHDTGPGLDKGQVNDLKNAFRNGNGFDRNPEGGLGLGIVLGLAREHRYGFDVTSRLGGGSVFSVELPRA
jgi:signal transduction histidine kinase